MMKSGLALIVALLLNASVMAAESKTPAKAADSSEAANDVVKAGQTDKQAASKSGEKESEAAKKQDNAAASGTAQAEVPAHAPFSTSDPVLVGNAQAGKDKTQTCVACHGNDGNSTVPNWPKIAGQYENYLVKQLKDYRAGEKGPRFEASMYGMVANLSDQDIADLAAFYAGQTQTMGKAQNAYVALGQRIYRGGNVQTGVTACLACHGPEGKGNEPARFPKLAGQHAIYIENQLIAFRDGKRKNSPNEMMESISHRMSDEEIKAVSSYIEGLS